MFKWAAVAGLAYYSYKAGLLGLKEDFRYVGNTIITPKEKPEDKLLFDPHCHFRLFKDRDDLEAMVQTFFKKTDFVNITASQPESPTADRRACTYEKFVEAIKTLNYEVKFSDQYATILNNGEKDLVFFKAQEVSTKNPYSKGHEIHINVMAHDYLPYGMQADEVLDKVGNHGSPAMLNHPFSKPMKIIKFWFPTKKEVRYLNYLCSNYPIFIEQFNAMNALWMAASNGRAEEFVRSFNGKRKGLGSTDAHGSIISNTKEMIGLAGTLLDKDPAITDFRSLTGKEMVQCLANYINRSNIEILGNYASPLLFFNVMVRRV